MRRFLLLLLLFLAPLLGAGQHWPAASGGIGSKTCGEPCLAAFFQARGIASPELGELTTVYLDPSGSDANDGLTAATPWQTLDKVSDIFATMGCGLEVVLADGGDWDADAEVGPGCATGAANCGFDAMVSDCADDNRIGIWFHTQTLEGAAAHFDDTALSNPPGEPCMYNNGGTGWVVFQNVHCTWLDTPIESTGTAGVGGNLLVLNSLGNVANGAAAPRVLDSINGNLIAVNWSGSIPSAPLSSAVIHASGSGSVVSITNQTGITLDCDGNNCAWIKPEDNSTIVQIGGSFDADATATERIWGIYPIPASSGDLPTIYMAKASFDERNTSSSASRLVELGAYGANQGARIYGYQITLVSDASDLIHALNPNASSTGGLFDCRDCIAIATAGAAKIVDFITDGSLQVLNGTFLTDTDVVASDFLLDSTTYTTAATFNAAAAAVGWDLSFTDVATTAQWGSNPNLQCDVSNACYQAASPNWCIPLAPNIPAWLLGTSVDQSRVCLHDQGRNVGAR